MFTGMQLTEPPADDLDCDIPPTLTKQQRARRKRQLRKKKLREVAQGLRPLTGNALQSKFGQQLMVRRAQNHSLQLRSPQIPELHSVESMEHDLERDDFQRQVDERIARMAQELHSTICRQSQPKSTTDSAAYQSLSSSTRPQGPHGDGPRHTLVDQASQTFPDESVLFCLPRPTPNHDFLELVRSQYPSPRYVPFTAFVFDADDSFEHSGMPVTEFNGEGSPLSNFFRVPLNFEGHQHDSAEHAYQWFKAMYCKRPKLAQAIMQAPIPSRAKQIAKKLRTAPLIDEFRKIKVQVMAQLLEHKFVQCQLFRQALVPGKRYLETTRDTYWGCGQTQEFRRMYPHDQALGLNKLGKLMSRLAHRGTLLKDDWQTTCVH